MILRVNQWEARFLGHVAHARLSWTSIPSRSVKVVTLSESRNLYHLYTLLYPPLLAVIFQTFGQLASQEFARFSVCGIRGAELQSSNGTIEV